MKFRLRVPASKKAWGWLLAVTVLLAALGLAAVKLVHRHLAGRALNEAEQALELDDFEGALKAAKRCIQYRPKEVRAYLIASKSARHLDKLKEAEDYLRDCEELQATATEEVQLEWLMLRACKGEVEGEVPGRLLRYGARKEAEGAEALEALIQGSHRSFRRPLADNYIDLWIRQYPDDYRAYMIRGQTTHGAVLQGVSDLRKAVELAPDRFAPRMRLVDTLIENGHFA